LRAGRAAEGDEAENEAPEDWGHRVHLLFGLGFGFAPQEAGDRPRSRARRNGRS
jgi:hypothetical protein